MLTWIQRCCLGVVITFLFISLSPTLSSVNTIVHTETRDFVGLAWMLHATTNYEAIHYDDYLLIVHVGNTSGQPNLELSKYFLDNQTFTNMTFPDSFYDYGTSYGEQMDGHWTASIHIDAYNHIVMFVGGHSTNDYPIACIRSNMSLDNSSFAFTNVSHWVRKANVQTQMGSCYHTDLVCTQGKNNGTYVSLYRYSTSGDGPIDVKYSTNNGTSWSNVSIMADHPYGIRGWFFCEEANDYIMVFNPREWTDDNDNHTHFLWTTLDDIISDNGAYSSNQSYGDTPNYEFLIENYEILPIDQFIGDNDSSYGGILFDDISNGIFMVKKNMTYGTPYLYHKTMFTEDAWATYGNITTGDAYNLTDIRRINDTFYIIGTNEDHKPVIEYTTTPLINTSWQEYIIDNNVLANAQMMSLFESNDIWIYTGVVGYSGGASGRYVVGVLDDFNEPPVVTSPIPSNNTDNMGITLQNLSFTISDPDGDTMNYTVEYNGISNTTNGASNGSQTPGLNYAIVNPLDYATTYTWYVNITDGVLSANYSFNFTTRSNQAPAQSNPYPIHDTTGINLTPTNMSITISDTEGETMNIYFYHNDSGNWHLADSNISVGNGTYLCVNTTWIDTYNTTYNWSVNVTDGTSWTNTSRNFTTRNVYSTIIRITGYGEMFDASNTAGTLFVFAGIFAVVSTLLGFIAVFYYIKWR